MWSRSRMASGLQSRRSTAVERPQAFPSLINSSGDSTGAEVGAIVGKTAPSALSNAFIDTEHLLVAVMVVRVSGYAELSSWCRTIAQYFPHAIFFFAPLEIFSLPVSALWRACNPGSVRGLPRRSAASAQVVGEARDRDEVEEVVRSSRLGADAGEAASAEWLAAHQRDRAPPVDVGVAD